MKKLISFGFLFFISVQFGFSQNYFGIKAGANVANMNMSTELLNRSFQNKNKIGAQLGIFAQREISSKLYLRSEVFYSSKGYKLNNSDRTIVSFHYINLPTLIGYKLSPDFSVFLGPQLGYLASVYSKEDRNDRSDNLRKGMGHNRIELSIGAGINYSLSPRINFDLRYNYGLTTILNIKFIDSAGNEQEGTFLKNNKSLEISFNYLFNLTQ